MFLFGQQTPKPSDRWNLGVKGFVDTNKAQNNRVTPRSDRTVNLSEVLQPVCSVPLIRAQIPDDVDYKIQQLPVPEGFSDGMPKVNSTPACSESAVIMKDNDPDLMKKAIEKLRERRLKK